MCPPELPFELLPAAWRIARPTGLPLGLVKLLGAKRLLYVPWQPPLLGVLLGWPQACCNAHCHLQPTCRAIEASTVPVRVNRICQRCQGR